MPQGNHYPAIPYVSPALWNDLVQYTDMQKYFTNVNVGDCGLITQCQLLPSGCANTYGGLGKMHPSTYAISFRQNVAAGYTETLCVECQNGHNGKTTKDNWVVEQTKDCG